MPSWEIIIIILLFYYFIFFPSLFFLEGWFRVTCETPVE